MFERREEVERLSVGEEPTRNECKTTSTDAPILAIRIGASSPHQEAEDEKVATISANIVPDVQPPNDE